MKNLRYIVRDPRSTVRAPPVGVCDSFVKCVTGSYPISVTQLPYVFQWLTSMCDRCDRCDSFFELYLRFFQNTVFFYKLNFNLKLPVTPVTHLYNPRDYSLFAISKLSHMLSHTCHTCPCSCHTWPRTTIHEPSLSIRPCGLIGRRFLVS